MLQLFAGCFLLHQHKAGLQRTRLTMRRPGEQSTPTRLYGSSDKQQDDSSSTSSPPPPYSERPPEYLPPEDERTSLLPRHHAGPGRHQVYSNQQKWVVIFSLGTIAVLVLGIIALVNPSSYEGPPPISCSIAVIGMFDSKTLTLLNHSHYGTIRRRAIWYRSLV
jgi:hypothetical protein